jgi:hypothetical protein
MRRIGGGSDGGRAQRGQRSLFDRLRRRTMAPSRPLLYPEQVGLALFSLLAIGGGIYAVARILL